MIEVKCVKCGCLVAKVEKPSTVKNGAKLAGVCYVCQIKSMANGKPAFDHDDFLKSFMDIFKN